MERFSSFLVAFRWQDGVDIVLSSYILFRLYVLLRGTNASRVLIGMAVLWVFLRVSAFFDLIVTSWAMQGIIAAAALIIVVVFRNEIRLILQARNLKGIVWGFPKRPFSTPVETLSDAVFEMARRRIGALLVFPGDEELSEHVHGAIPWNGQISKEMILSIFWEGNPVHDGAAVIQGDKVTEVGGLIPLSRREDLPYYYGTRHRAAAGLAELSDALVIVVSEERGQVSAAKGQDIRVVRGKQELQEILEAHAGVSTRQGGHRKAKQLEMATAALVSLFFIGGVWFSFTQGLDTLITLDVPIEYVNRDPGLEILNTSRNSVALELSGSGSLVRAVRPDQVQVRLDLSRAKPGENRMVLGPETVNLPPGVILKNIHAPRVDVTMDLIVRKDLSVKVDWTGKLRDGLILQEVRVDPERIQVQGVKSLLDKTAVVNTEKIDLAVIQESGSILVRLALNPALKLAGGHKDRVLVHYTVGAKSGSQ